MMTEPIARLAIHLQDVQPPVRRRIDVPLSMNLRTLHETIQACFGWTNTHLYMFDIAGEHFGEPHPDYEPDQQLLQADATRISTPVKTGCRRLKYIYDFGDYWLHDIKIERVTTGDSGTEYPTYIRGAGRTPPENIGGAGGYAEFLERIGNPGDTQHDETIEWLKTTGQEQQWPGNTFDDAAARAAVNEIARRRRTPPEALTEIEKPT